MNLAAIRAELAGALEAAVVDERLAGWHTYPDANRALALPAIVVGRPSVQAYNKATGGTCELSFALWIIAAADAANAVELVDTALSRNTPGSVVDVVQSIDVDATTSFHSIVVQAAPEPFEASLDEGPVCLLARLPVALKARATS